MARNQGIHALIRFTGNIRTLCEQGQLVEALQDVELMCQKGVDVSTDIFYCLVQCCVNCKSLAAGRRVHSLIVRSGFEANTFLASHLIRMFTFFESLLDANQVFSQLPSPSAFAWSATISAHAKLRQPEQAIELYKQMKLSRVIPNVYVFLNVLKACSNTAALEQGKVIHAHIIENSVDADIAVRNTLIDMYAKCGSLEDAHRVFEKLPNQDVVTWNAMIAGFAYNGHFQDGLCLFKKMQRQGMDPNSVTWNAMIAGYVKHGLGLDALRFFHQMQQEGVQPSKATLISSVQACSSIAAFECGKVIHVQINESSFKSDVVVGSTLIDMYVKCGRLEDARSVFDSLPKADLVTCNAMICGYAQQGEGQLALRFFQQMQHGGMKPDNFTFVSILKACSKIGALEQGKEIHFHVIECGFECDIFIGSTLIDMYSKWHSLEDGHRVFEKLPKRNIVTWNAIIAGYVQCSDYKSVLQHFYNMQHEGVKPDAVTFICLLSVCSHVGLVDEAYDHFKLMKADYGITPTLDHYDCMVDLLGRVGYLNEAVELLKGIPFQVGIMAWRSLLGHCRTHGHVEFGRLCFNEVITMDVKDSAGYVLMSNIYVDSGMWGDSDKLQECRKSAGAQKKAGMAFIEIDNQVHRFLVGERSHPTGEVFGKLKRLSGQMKLTSYVPSLDLVLQSLLDEDEDI